MSGNDEVTQPLYARARLLPASGGSCASTASADKGSSLSGSGTHVHGTFSQTFKTSFSSAGSWLVCGWLDELELVDPARRGLARRRPCGTRSRR